MTKSQILSVAVAFGGGVLLGLSGEWRRGATKSSGELAQATTLRSALEALQNENRDLNAKLARALAERPSSASATETTRAADRGPALTHLDELKALANLQQKKLVKPAITFLDRKGKLDSTFADLFALTPPEQERLQGVVDDVREKLAQLERANAKLTRDEHGNIVVAVQPFPTEGGKVYDEMMRTFADVLGPERDDVYRKIGAEQVENTLGRFGAAERTYTFGYDTSERPGQPYTFEDKVMQRTPNGGVSGNTNRTRFQSFDDLTARVGPIVSILPPDYKRAK